MSNFREINDNDILAQWIAFREEYLSSLTCEEDKKHWIYFEEIAKNILRNVPNENKKYVQNQLNKLDDNFLDYITYWNEKYYRNGFVDGSQMVMGVWKNSKRRELVSPFLYLPCHPIILVYTKTILPAIL